MTGIASAVLLSTAGCSLVPGQTSVVQGWTNRHSIQTPQSIAINRQQGQCENSAAMALDAGDYVEAEDQARQSIVHNMGSGKGQELLAEALNAQGKDPEALQAYKVLADAGSVFPRTLLPYALLLLRSGQWAQAVNTYNKQLPYLSFGALMQANSHFSPDVPQPEELETAIHTALGLTYINQSSWGGRLQSDKAMREFDLALHLAPDSPLTNYYYGYGWQQLDPKSRTKIADAPRAKAALHKAAASEDADIKQAAVEALKKRSD